MRVVLPIGTGINGGRMVGVIVGAIRVEPLFIGRGSMRPEISLPSSGNIAVRAIGAAGAVLGAGVFGSAASGSIAVASRPSESTMASESS